MGRGTHRGFITYEELSKSLGKRNLSDENLAQAFIHILDENISLVEKNQILKFLEKKKIQIKKKEKQLRKVMILSECICVKWEVLSYFQEKEKLQLQKE